MVWMRDLKNWKQKRKIKWKATKQFRMAKVRVLTLLKDKGAPLCTYFWIKNKTNVTKIQDMTEGNLLK